MNYFLCIIGFLQTYNGAVTAVATIFVGIFTFVLARVTGRQARLTRESVDLGRAEFIASNRPKFEVREAHLAVIHCPAEPLEQTTYQARFILANSGGSDGALVESFAVVMAIPVHSWTQLGAEDNLNMFGEIKLAAGAYKEIAYDLPKESFETISLMLAMHEDNQPRGGNLYFRGSLAYIDTNGTKRRTAFCRSLDLNTLRFIRTADQEYDYCD